MRYLPILINSPIVAVYIVVMFCFRKRASTYVNVVLGHENCIDYILTSCPKDIVDFDVLYPDVKFSDHLPLSVKIHISVGNKPRNAGFI